MTCVEKKVDETEEDLSGIDWKDLKHKAKEDGLSTYCDDVITKAIRAKKLLKTSKEYAKNKKFINVVKDNSQNALQSYALLINHRGWETQVENDNNISVYYRKEKSLDIHSIKIKFLLNCPVLHMLSVLHEFDLIGQLMQIPGTTIETKYLKEVSPIEKILFAQMNLIWPLRHRDVVTHVKAYDLLKAYDCILITGKSVEKYKKIKNS